MATVKRKKPPGPKAAKGKSTAAKDDARRCGAPTKSGKPCRTNKQRGLDTCLAHADQATRESAGFGGAQPGAGRPRATRPVEAINQLVQSNVLAFVTPHLRAIGLEGYVDEETGELAVRDLPGGGAKLYSTSEGTVYVSSHEDLEAAQKAAERLFDRGFGKPVQTNLLGGAGDGKPIEVDVPTTAERVREVAEVLKELGLE